MKMEYLTIPEFPVLRGEKAIKAPNGFVNELEERRCEQLTEEQTTTLINIAKALLSSVQA